MKLKDQTKWFIYGVAAAFAITAVFHVSTAMAASAEKQITVLMGGIRLFVDGVPVETKDSAGNVAEPFIFNGVTYVPAKSIATAMNMPLKWDGKTSSVYLGKDDQGIVYLSDLAPYTWDGITGIIYNNDQQHHWGDHMNNYTMTSGTKEYAKGIGICGNQYNAMYLMYNLNGKYRTLKGKIAFQDLYEGIDVTIKFFADGVMKKQVVVRKGDLPAAYTLDLNNCLQLKVEASISSSSMSNKYFNIIDPVLEQTV